MLLYATGVTPTAAKPFPPLPPPTDTTASVLVLNNDRFQYSSVYDDQNWCLISGNNVLTILADGAYRTTDYAGSDLTPYAAAVDVPSSRVFVKAYSTSRGIAILDIWEWQGKTPVLTRVKALDLDKTWATQTYALQVEAGIVYVDCGRMTYTTEGVFIAQNPTAGDGRGLSFHLTDKTKAVRCSAWTGVNGSTKIYSNAWTFYVFNKGVAVSKQVNPNWQLSGTTCSSLVGRAYYNNAGEVVVMACHDAYYGKNTYNDVYTTSLNFGSLAGGATVSPGNGYAGRGSGYFGGYWETENFLLGQPGASNTKPDVDLMLIHPTAELTKSKSLALALGFYLYDRGWNNTTYYCSSYYYSPEQYAALTSCNTIIMGGVSGTNACVMLRLA